MEEEALHLDYLGSEVAPKVYMFGQNPDGTGRIVMEQLPILAEYDLLIYAVRVLGNKVWNRPPHPLWGCGSRVGFDQKTELHWTNQFWLRFDFGVPTWVSEGEEYCCIHGDPTLANIAFSGTTLRFLDPKPPGNGIPPFLSVDLGKIMQSWMGWEVALLTQTGGEIPKYFIEQYDPFDEIDEELLRRATFWCMVHFLRIVHREGQSGLGHWAAKNVRALQELIGMADVNIGLGPRWDAGRDEVRKPDGL